MLAETPFDLSPRRRLHPGVDGWTLASSEAVVLTVGSLVALGAVLVFLSLAARFGPDFWVPALLLGVLACASVPAIRASSGRPMDRRLFKILIVAFALKMLCTVPRYAVNEMTYGGSSDARGYNQGGQVLRLHVLEDGEWSLRGAHVNSFPDETKFVAYVTGALYLVTGGAQMAAYLMFAWIGWIGLMACFRAFRLAYPNAPPYRAAVLIFLLPSTLYWPSSLGKDALMLFGLGLITLGSTRLLVGQRPLLGLGWIVLGAAPILQVRPHLLLIVLVGGAFSLIARNSGAGMSTAAVVGRLLLLAALVPALLLGLARVNDAFGTTGDAGFTVSGAMRQTSEMTSTGGSAFATRPVQSPVDLPVATVNVLFRPFIFETSSLPSLISSLETTVLLVLAVGSVAWLWRMFPEALRNPLAAYCLGYSLAFIIAFANIGNAGILARQRTQLFPMLMILVAAGAEAHRLRTVGAPTASPAGPSLSLDAPRLVTLP